MSREPERGRREGPSSALRFDRAEAPKGKDSPAPKWRKTATRKAKEQAPEKFAPGGRGAGSALPPSVLPTQAAAPTEGETVTGDNQPPRADGAVLQEKGAKIKAGAAVTVHATAKGRDALAAPGPVTSGQNVPKSPYRQKSNAQPADRLHQAKDGGALRQDPEAPQSSRDGGSGGQRAAAPAGPEGSKLRMEKSKLRMEKREGNLNRAKEKKAT